MWLGCVNPQTTTQGTKVPSDERSDKNCKAQDKIRFMANVCKHRQVGIASSQKSLRISMFSPLELMEGLASWEHEQKVIQQEDVIKNLLEMKNVVIKIFKKCS